MTFRLIYCITSLDPTINGIKFNLSLIYSLSKAFVLMGMVNCININNILHHDIS